MRADLALLLCLPATILAVEIVLFLKFRQVLGAWMGVMNASTTLFADKSLSDDEKQERMAKAAGQTLIGTFKIFAIIVVALAGFVAIYGAGISVFWIDTSLPETLMRLEVQLGSLVVAIVWIWVRGRVFG